MQTSHANSLREFLGLRMENFQGLLLAVARVPVPATILKIAVPVVFKS